jgi:AraC family transcriptional regulator
MRTTDETFTHRVIASKEMPGVSFQVVDYHWNARADILDCQPELMLRWRMRPYRIKAEGWVKPGKPSKFGQLMLHPSLVETHAKGADVGEDSRTLVCKFDPEWLEQIVGSRIITAAQDLEPIFDLRHSGINHTMKRLMHELLEPSMASDILVEGLAMSTAVDIARILGTVDDSEEVKGILSRRRMSTIREFVESFEDGSPTLSDIAKECGISVAHLRKLYKATTGQTLHNYIEGVRTERARNLLLDTNLSLKVISYKLGFGHPSAFSFAFKKMTGEAPRDFRIHGTSDRPLSH